MLCNQFLCNHYSAVARIVVCFWPIYSAHHGELKRKMAQDSLLIKFRTEGGVPEFVCNKSFAAFSMVGGGRIGDFDCLSNKSL